MSEVEILANGPGLIIIQGMRGKVFSCFDPEIRID